jgi:outer membrane receptor protein involved in Fe transport
MKTTILALFAVFLFTYSSFSQGTHGVKGITIDSVSKAKLSGSVSVLDAKDSVLRKFTYADDNGAFAINGLPAGKYLLFVTYPGYDEKMKPFTLGSPNAVSDLGNVNLGVTNVLGEATVKGPVQEIKIKGDTLEFNAKAYVIQPNSKVEDLLKQIPGIQIDKNGKITMNGEAVPKVLVDGEEFFGDDPTLVTQNLRGDMVDKIQIYDKKSDQAAFTGIDDGVKTKTINVKLKEDKKRGIFGKLSAGAGTDEYYETQALFNKFTARSKFAAYGTIANTGKTGLGVADNSRIGSTTGVQIGDTGGLLNSGGGDDDLDANGGNYNGNGLPQAKAGGVHYDTKIKSDASINANYKIGALDVEGKFVSSSQVNLPGAIQSSASNRNFKNETFRQNADLSYFTKLDTSSTLKVDVNAIDKNLKTTSNALTTIRDENDNIILSETRRTFNDSRQKSYGISALYTKKFSKPRRTFTWNLSHTYAENNADGYLFSDITSANSAITDQLKTVRANNRNVSSNMTYSEPLSALWSVQLNYGLGINNTINTRNSFDKSTATSQYDILNTVFSNDFKTNQVTNQVGANFNYRKDKTILTFGTRTSFVDFDQLERYNNRTFKRSFVNWIPQVVYQYQMSSQKAIQAYYSGSMRQPTANELQPIPNNADPLRIVLGNADLKPAFTHYFQGNYRSQQIISRQSMSISASYNFAENEIIQKLVIDNTGKTTVQSVNLGDKRPDLITASVSGSRRISGTEIDVNFGLGFRRSTSYTDVNNVLNKFTNYTYQGSIGVQTVKLQKYEFGLRFNPTYNPTRYSITPQSNNNIVGGNINSRVKLFLPGKFILESDFYYTYQAKTQSVEALNLTVLTAALSKTFLKEQNLKLSISGNNLLNANPSLNRSITSTGISQSNYNTIMRYFLLSVSWDFTKFGTTATK